VGWLILMGVYGCKKSVVVSRTRSVDSFLPNLIQIYK